MSDWRPMSEKPEKIGWYPVFARSADPGKPLRHLCYWDGEEWSGLVPMWMEALTHWLPWPADPEEEEEPTE